MKTECMISEEILLVMMIKNDDWIRCKHGEAVVVMQRQGRGGLVGDPQA